MTETNPLQAEIERLRAENQQLKEQLAEAQQKLREAKDTSPVVRPSFKRTIQLVHQACMSLERCGRKWLLKMGHLQRTFASLKEIWQLLNQKDWVLTEVFTTPSKVVKPQVRLGEAQRQRRSRSGVGNLMMQEIAEYQAEEKVRTSPPPPKLRAPYTGPGQRIYQTVKDAFSGKLAEETPELVPF